jgi:ribosomal subunit interface protein
MKVKVSGKHVDIGDSLHAYVKDHLTETIEKFFETSLDAQAVLSKNHHNFRCDLTVHIGRGLTIRCHGESDDGYKCVDQAIHKLNEQMKKYKKKLKNHHKDKEALMEYLEAQKYIIDTQHEDTIEGDNPLIIAEMDLQIPTISVSEAVMRMDLEDSPAVMFKNIKHGEFNIVYRRADGNIGWIDPKQLSQTGTI